MVGEEQLVWVLLVLQVWLLCLLLNVLIIFICGSFAFFSFTILKLTLGILKCSCKSVSLLLSAEVQTKPNKSTIK
jgi:hypothetical protein